MDELEKLRAELARTDQELLQLFLRRMQIVASVAEHKGRTKGTVFVPEQEKRVIKEVQAKTPPEFWRYATVLAQTVMRLSRERQYELFFEMDPAKADRSPFCQGRKRESSANNTMAVVEGLPVELVQMVQDLYPKMTFMPLENAAIACNQVVNGLKDLAILPLRGEVFVLLEKHALFIQACLPYAGERYVVVGLDLVQFTGEGQVNVILHGSRKISDEPVVADSLSLIVNILSDLELPIVHIESLNSGSLYFEFLVCSSLDRALRALYQIEQEIGEVCLLGYYA